MLVACPVGQCIPVAAELAGIEVKSSFKFRICLKNKFVEPQP
jgi:hypothetical protein